MKSYISCEHDNVRLDDPPKHEEVARNGACVKCIHSVRMIPKGKVLIWQRERRRKVNLAIIYTHL